MSSLCAKQSCSSTTSTSSGPMPGGLVHLPRRRLRHAVADELHHVVRGERVRACRSSSPAPRSRRSCRDGGGARTLPDTRTAAAAPHVGGHAISRVITPGISTGEASTSSTLTSRRKSASGLFVAWRLALARIRGERLERRAVLLHVREARRRRSSGSRAARPARRPARRSRG